MLNLLYLFPKDSSNKEPLSPLTQQLLRQQTFSANQPSTIVQDFEAVIEFLQLHKV